jgi:Contact-dependent growth inhibition CdiA C-terminal domain
VGIDGQCGSPDSGDEYPGGAHERRHEHKSSDGRSDGNPAETRSRQEYYESLSSSGSTEAGTARPWRTAKPAIDRHEWQAPLAEGSVDRIGPGVIDERAKKFSPAERRIAEYLASGGSAVVSVHEGYGVHGRTPDAQVNAVSVEFKALDPGASDRTVKAALNSAKGQARHAVIDARSSGLTEDEAQHGMKRFFGTPHGNRMDAVLIIGDDYSIDWKRGDD